MILLKLLMYLYSPLPEWARTLGPAEPSRTPGSVWAVLACTGVCLLAMLGLLASGITSICGGSQRLLPERSRQVTEKSIEGDKRLNENSRRVQKGNTKEKISQFEGRQSLDGQ
jgi:hypothetical protein